MVIIKKYPKARLEGCEQKFWKEKGKIIMRSHKNGCYLRLKDDKTDHSMSCEDDVFIPKKKYWKHALGLLVLDFNKNEELIGIDFVDGLPYKIKRKK